MYQLVTGPFAWVAFIIFFFGLILRILFYLLGIKVPGNDNVFERIKKSIRFVLIWLFPFASKSFRKNPGFTISIFIFHIGLILIPVFLIAHNVILKQKWGFRFLTLSEATTDVLTIVVIVSIVLVIFRRIALTEVRTVTSPFEYVLLIITGATFITGFIAYHQFSYYQFWLITHIVCAEILLVTIPFWPTTKPKHPKSVNR
jgi:nitrate reductase gamma subunit